MLAFLAYECNYVGNHHTSGLLETSTKLYNNNTHSFYFIFYGRGGRYETSILYTYSYFYETLFFSEVTAHGTHEGWYDEEIC